MEMRLADFFDNEDIFVMGVSDSAPAFPNRNNLGPITSRKIKNNYVVKTPNSASVQPLDIEIKGSRLFSARKNLRRPPMLSLV